MTGPVDQSGATAFRDEIVRVASFWRGMARKAELGHTEATERRDATVEASTLHPHEPDIPPALDPEGRCLVCGILVERDAAMRDAAEARYDLEQQMGEVCVRQGELDDVARLVGVGVDAPYHAVLAGVRALREALSESLEAMVHRPVDSELFARAIANAGAALGRMEEPDA